MDESFFKALSDVEYIRTRPGMYVGGLNNRGLNALWVDPIRDQWSSAESRIIRTSLQIEEDGWLTLEFRGRITDIVPADDYISLVGSDTFIHSLAITSALSERLELEVVQEGERWRQQFIKGRAKKAESVPASDAPYVRLRFMRDRSLFKPEHCVGFHTACGQMQEFAILHPTGTFCVNENATRLHSEYRYAHGLLSYMQELEYRNIVNQDLASPNLFCLKFADAGDFGEAVILDRTGPSLVRAFVNGRRCEKGTHIVGLNCAMAEVSRLVSVCDRDDGDLAESDPLAGKTILLSIRTGDPQWDSPTLDVYGNLAGEILVYRMIIEQLPQQMIDRRQAVIGG